MKRWMANIERTKYDVFLLIARNKPMEKVRISYITII